MNCKRCHHTNEVHVPFYESSSLMKMGRCQIPGCTCQQFSDPIHVIDEELI